MWVRISFWVERGHCSSQEENSEKNKKTEQLYAAELAVDSE